MKKIFLPLIAIAVSIVSCSKSDTSTPAVDFTTQEQTVITDFVNKTALPQYSNLSDAANVLNTSIAALAANTTAANLQAAQASWKSIRKTWEQTEGFLFGPIEDNDYDPNTDTWPTDYAALDSILLSSNPLEVSDISALRQSLRGYHPLEYVLFGKGNGRTIAELTPRLLKYASSLSADIYLNNAQPLYQSWAQAPTNYAQLVLNPGSSNAKFQTRRDVFLAVIGAMADICDEVGSGKMYEPFIAKDSNITESPYSDNTAIDFKNNITGVQNVYMGMNGGTGLKDLVAFKNKSLDNKIQAQITSAINSFGNITVSYEKAIFDQRVQVQQTMDQLEALKDLLNGELTDFVNTYVQD